MLLPTLHRAAVLGLLFRDQQADEQYRRDKQARDAEWVEVLHAVEGVLALPYGAMGTTHTLDLATMQVLPLPPAEPQLGFTPVEEAP